MKSAGGDPGMQSYLSCFLSRVTKHIGAHICCGEWACNMSCRQSTSCAVHPAGLHACMQGTCCVRAVGGAGVLFMGCRCIRHVLARAVHQVGLQARKTHMLCMRGKNDVEEAGRSQGKWWTSEQTTACVVSAGHKQRCVRGAKVMLRRQVT
eukprot:1159007-Pelagomonas_calceolata.AAC.7